MMINGRKADPFYEHVVSLVHIYIKAPLRGKMHKPSLFSSDDPPCRGEAGIVPLKQEKTT
jgi:hypothetical protein